MYHKSYGHYRLRIDIALAGGEALFLCRSQSDFQPLCVLRFSFVHGLIMLSGLSQEKYHSDMFLALIWPTEGMCVRNASHSGGAGSEEGTGSDTCR